MRPVRATALYIVRYFKAFALSGRQVTAQNKNPGRSWAKSFCPFRACCCGLLDHQGVLLLWAAWTSGRCCYGLLGVAAYMGFWPFMALLSHANFAEFSELYGWNYPACPSVRLNLPYTPFCMVEITLHALKGQKLLAQGNALGINDIQLTPCKGKSFTYRRGFSHFY